MMSPTRVVLVLLALVLLALVLLASVAIVGRPKPLCPGSGGRQAAPEPSPPAEVTSPKSGSVLDLADFLPAFHVTDGSEDYTEEVQLALDSAEGATLVLPPYPIRVSRRAGQTWCLRVAKGMTIEGTPSSVLLETSGSCQVLRGDGALGLRLSGFSIQGAGGQGRGLAHGLLQITGGSDVTVEGLHVRDADADGVAIAGVARALVQGCRVSGCSKTGIYLAGCSDSIVAHNLVTEGTGHWTAAGSRIGTGIQISSSRNAICRGNLVSGGVGVGILCNANSGGEAPQSCAIVDNLVEGVRNPQSRNVSSGIRCANGARVKMTYTRVAGNSVRDCGDYGIYVEDHGGSMVVDNLIVESDRSGLVVGTVYGLRVAGNLILDSGSLGMQGDAGIYLINDASHVDLSDNLIRSSGGGWCSGAAHLLDSSQGPGNSLQPRILWLHGPPVGEPWATTAWRAGDLVYNRNPRPGKHVGWVCTRAGTPGEWCPFGLIE